VGGDDEPVELLRVRLGSQLLELRFRSTQPARSRLRVAIWVASQRSCGAVFTLACAALIASASLVLPASARLMAAAVMLSGALRSKPHVTNCSTATVFLVPFFALVVLWWLPGTSRGVRAKAG